MAILKKLIIASLPFMLTGCYENFDPHIDAKPVLCINSLITAGQTVNVKVSRSWLYSDFHSENDHSVRDASVRILVNGESADSGYLPQEGDHIRIEASSATYGEAWAEVTVPHAIPVESIEFTPIVGSLSADNTQKNDFNTRIHFDADMHLIIPDDDKTDNYFLLNYKSFTPHNAFSFFFNGSFKYEQELVFSEHISDFELISEYSPFYEYPFFTDRQFRNEKYPLHVRIDDCAFAISVEEAVPEYFDCGYEFTLYTVSESYYNWLNYAWQSGYGMIGELGEAGLAEPIRGYSNVSTGAGVVAAQSSTRATVDFQDFLMEATGYTKPTADPSH